MWDIKLGSFRRFDRAKASFDGRLQFETTSEQWHYSAALPLPWFYRTPTVVEIEAEVDRGEIRLDCIDLGSGRAIGGKVLVGPSSRGIHKLLLEERGLRPAIMIRNALADGTTSIGRVLSARARPATDQAEYRRLKARGWDYWHYSYDLGAGAAIEANIDGIMPMHDLNHKILMTLLERNFGAVRGRTVVDVACASGFHSFALARQGASVTSIDIDMQSIEQARFLQSCDPGLYPATARFLHGDLLTFKSPQPHDFGFCSGLFYHLVDPVGGARALFDLVRTGAVIHSHVVAGEGEFLALADARKYKCCFDGEFAFMPTRAMLQRIFEHVGFKVASHRPDEIVGTAEIQGLPAEFATLFADNTAYYVLTR